MFLQTSQKFLPEIMGRMTSLLHILLILSSIYGLVNGGWGVKNIFKRHHGTQVMRPGDRERLKQQKRLNSLRCPPGSIKVNSPQGFNDIGGCGITGCENRYQDLYPNINACKLGCDSYSQQGI